MSTYRVGLVGFGYIGKVHAFAHRNLPFFFGSLPFSTQLVRVCTGHADSARAAGEFLGVEGVTDFRAVTEAPDIDVVHICTPNASHFEMAMYAMERGISVVCEKPLTKTLEEARQLAAYAREHNIVTGVNFNCRWYPQVMQAKAMVESGEVGDIYTVHGGYLQDWLYYDTDYSWRLEPEMSGESRAFADIGSHWIDMVEAVTGLRAVEVFSDFETFHKTRKKPLKPIDTYSGMALRPEDMRKSPSIPRITARFCSALTTARTAPAPSARSLPAGRTRCSWTLRAASAPCTGTARTATSSGLAAGILSTRRPQRTPPF